jgi:hypothetical protein
LSASISAPSSVNVSAIMFLFSCAVDTHSGESECSWCDGPA